MATVLERRKSSVGIRAWASRHPLGAFFTLAFAISWLAWAPFAFLGYRGPGRMVMLLLGGFGPLAAGAIVTSITGGSAGRWLRAILHWRAPARLYAYALGLPGLLLLFVNLELALLGHDVDLGLLPQRIPAYLVSLLLVAVLGGGLEEPGWRGFALPRLQASRSPLAATIILGLVWGIWHVPLYGPLGFAVPLVLAFFYTWLYNRSGNVLLCILLHASFTSAIDLLVLLPNDGRGVVAVDAALFGTMIAGAGALVLLTRGRMGVNRRR